MSPTSTGLAALGVAWRRVQTPVRTANVVPWCRGAAAKTPTEEVVVLDYGGQYSQLIARRVRECGVFSELLPHHVGAEEVPGGSPKGVILSGGPASVYSPARRRSTASCWSSGSRCSASVTECS